MAGFRRTLSQNENTVFRSFAAILMALAVALSLALAPDAFAQNNKKKKNAPPITVDNDNAHPVVPMTDEQQIDYLISEYLGAWQLGDVEKMHKDYSDDVSVASGGWNAPIVGWNNYVALYQQQRSHMERVRMDRMNTFLKVNGNTAWTCYQWEFAAVVDGNSALIHGQTTLVLVKKDVRWLIIHDHTSVVDSKKPGPGSGTPTSSPGTSPSGTPPPTDKPQAK